LFSTFLQQPKNAARFASRRYRQKFRSAHVNIEVRYGYSRAGSGDVQGLERRAIRALPTSWHCHVWDAEGAAGRWIRDLGDASACLFLNGRCAPKSEFTAAFFRKEAIAWQRAISRLSRAYTADRQDIVLDLVTKVLVLKNLCRIRGVAPQSFQCHLRLFKGPAETSHVFIPDAQQLQFATQGGHSQHEFD
jgi:hypothetical protein